MTTSHCIPETSLAGTIVNEGWVEFHDIALDAVADAGDAVNAISAFHFDSHTPLTIAYNLAGLEPGVFVPPTAPTRVIPAFTMPSLPAAPTLAVTAAVSVGEAPAEPDTPVVYLVPGGEPGDFDIVPPDTTLDLDLVVLPDAPTYTIPELPDLYALDLPDPPTLNLPVFAGERPEVDFAAPQLTFGFNEVEYTSELMDAVKARLITQSAGGTGIPVVIERALFDRARTRGAREAVATVQGVAEDFSNRGFDEPPRWAAHRMMQVRQANQDAANALSRDILIKASDLEREQLRDFVAQGIALEQVTIGKHMQVQQRAFDAARYLMQAALDIFNAKVARVNLEASIYTADATVYRAQLDGALAQAQLYKTQIDGQVAIGQLNEGLVRLYVAQFDGVKAMVDIYRASVEAAATRNEFNKQTIEAKRTEVQLFAERVKAYETQWTGYGKKVDASLGVLRGQELATSVYTAKVGAWQTKQNVGFEAARTELSGQELRLRKYLADLEAYGKQISAQSSAVDAASRALAAEASVYEAGGRIAQAQSAATDRTFELHMRAAEIEANLTLQSGRENLQAGLSEAQLALEALRTIAQIKSQIAAGALSAVNLSASITSSQSASRSCSENFTFAGEIADA